MTYLGRLLLSKVCLVATLAGCSTSGSYWMAETPPLGDDPDLEPEDIRGSFTGAANGKGESRSAGLVQTHVISIGGEPRPSRPPGDAWNGKVLGVFRNTYYDFPNEVEFRGDSTPLHGRDCQPIAYVASGFFDAVCVQGSGRLSTGQTVSFARRDCSCARVCPRTKQRICFDALSMEKYPWGRGATGKPITPLVTIAVDSNVIPMDTPVYIPEYDGMPRDLASTSLHDGCFIAQDRGMKVRGQHVDIFTGQPQLTALWNKLVPSNQGVTVVVESRRCNRAGVLNSR